MHGSEGIVIFLNRMIQILVNLMNIRAILYYSQTTGLNYTNVVNEFLLLRLQLVISILQTYTGWWGRNIRQRKETIRPESRC